VLLDRDPFGVVPASARVPPVKVGEATLPLASVEPTSRARSRPRSAAAEVLTVFAVVVSIVAAVSLLIDMSWRSLAGPRNPYFRRLVPWWVMETPPKAPGEFLVVILGNSQAYGREMPASAIYSSLLGPRLQARRAERVRVVNWAIPGGNAPEFILQAAAAQRLNADVVLVMAGPGNFARSFWGSPKKPFRLDALVSDARQLLAWPEVFSRLPPHFRDHYVRLGDRIDAELARALTIWRYRDLPRSLLLRAAPVLRHFERDGGQERWFPVRFYKGRARRIAPWKEVALEPALEDQLLATLGTLPGRRVVARQPAHTAIRWQAPGLVADLRQYAPAGVEVLDLKDALSDDQFLSAAHLTAEGHAMLASRLVDLLAHP
jgi:hypothetical protein